MTMDVLPLILFGGGLLPILSLEQRYEEISVD